MAGCSQWDLQCNFFLEEILVEIQTLSDVAMEQGPFFPPYIPLVLLPQQETHCHPPTELESYRKICWLHPVCTCSVLFLGKLLSETRTGTELCGSRVVALYPQPPSMPLLPSPNRRPSNLVLLTPIGPTLLAHALQKRLLKQSLKSMKKKS